MVPHAGYAYSGPVAAHSYKRLFDSVSPDTVVIVGPNHTGRGTAVSVTLGEWSTPLGSVQIDERLARRIAKKSGLIDFEESAHKYEHSIEVQLPFLQYLFNSDLSFVPICMMLQDLETSRNVGRAVAESVEDGPSMIIASSDWTHYEPYVEARRKDMLAIEEVAGLDEKRFQCCIEENMISSCGFGPVTAVMCASKRLGASRAELLSYQTSGDVTGDKSSVVGYAAIAFTK